MARNSDLILMMLDASKGDKERDILENELNQCGIRLNTRPVDIYFVRKKTGGIKYTATARSLKNGLDEAGCKAILQEYTCHNCEVIIKEDATCDEFIGRLAPYSQAPYSQTQSAAVRSPLGASRRHPSEVPRVSLPSVQPTALLAVESPHESCAQRAMNGEHDYATRSACRKFANAVNISLCRSSQQVRDCTQVESYLRHCPRFLDGPARRRNECVFATSECSLFWKACVASTEN